MRKKKATVIPLGSVYNDSAAVAPGFTYFGGSLTIGNSITGKELSWVKTDSGLLICTDIAIKDVSFIRLQENGLVSGKPVKIDGDAYICRCLKVGRNPEDLDNEWDSTLKEYGDAEELWNAKSFFFWGIDDPDLYDEDRVIRGFRTPDYWGVADPTQAKCVGFRPALSPVDGELVISSELTGIMVTVYNVGGTISGIVADLTDYDLFLDLPNDVAAPANTEWYSVSNNKIIIDRTQIEFVIKA